MANRKGNAPYLDVVEHDPDADSKKVLLRGNTGSDFVDVLVNDDGEIAVKSTYDGDTYLSGPLNQGSSQTLVAANSSRKGGLLIGNPTAATFYVAIGDAASGNSLPVARFGTLHLPTRAAVYAYQAGASTYLVPVTEFT